MESMSIYEILKNFRAPLSEEQAWAVCYQCTRELVSQRETGFQTFQKNIIDIQLSTTKILKDGSVEFTSISPTETPQKENEVLFRLGSLVYECLDFGMEVCMERELDPALEKLITEMTCEQGDEGISVPEYCDDKHTGIRGTSPPKKERRLSSKGVSSKDMSLERVLQSCTEHLAGDQAKSQVHFKAVCRALVNEAIELTAFLNHLYNGHELMAQTSGQGVGLTNWAYLQSLHAAEWAQLWLQAMRELRQGVTLRHVVHNKLPPASFEMTPFEMLLDDIRYRRFNLNHVSIQQNTLNKSKDAHDVILDFIRSRPPLARVSERKMNPVAENSPNLHDKLLTEIKSCKKLKPTPQPVLKTVQEIYYGEDLNLVPNDISASVTHKRRRLKPDLEFVEKISRWDSPTPDSSPEEKQIPRSSVVEIKSVRSRSLPTSPRAELFEQFDSVADVKQFDSSRSSGFYEPGSSQSSLDSVEDNSCVRNGKFSGNYTLGFDDNPIFPPSLRNLQNMKVTAKIYMTLNEVRHMCKTLAMLELENFDPDDPTYRSLISGQLCFCCRKRKFSLFGEWSRPCYICESCVCSHCLHKVETSSSYVFMENECTNKRDSGFCDSSPYFPVCASSMPNSFSSPALTTHCMPTKTHRVCLTCKRFISKHC
ncbi:protein spire homolog 1 [Nematostella vectensis]|uniref:protein spire homolog 1 n=1 Tax=Nematostella vectensis TaxID=45351 RepID=UPI002076EE29|nr:protein spire homolog 1 [Nematostella vectensis]